MGLVAAGPQKARVLHDAGFVRFIVNGKEVACMPPQAARALANALKHNAGLAEEFRAPQKAIMDQAILVRAGCPVGLVHDKGLKHEAFKEAQGNRDLRRYMPHGPGIPSEEGFGVPVVKLGSPPKKE